MKTFNLSAEERKVTGKKVKKLRKEGILPANVYGKDIKSISLQLPKSEFDKTYSEAGETGVVDLRVGKKTIPVLIHNLQTDYRGNVLHADFFKVNLKEKVKTNVSIEIVGEAKAVTEKIGLLMEITKEVEVEALPTDLPEKIEVNVENLANIDDQVLISDIKTPKGVEILTEGTLVVAKIGELVSKEAQKEAEEEAAATEAAAAESAEATEGEEKPEGDGATAEDVEKPQESEEKSEDKG